MNYRNVLAKVVARRCMPALALLLSVLFSPVKSQGQDHKLGAVFLSDAEYAQLPRPNWDSLRQYANPANIVSGGARTAARTNGVLGSGITMLINPPIGDQGGEGSCVGWAVGYTALGILTYSKYNCWNGAERSPNYVYNQIKVLPDCGSGSFPKDALNLIQTQGDCAWNLMPYVDGDCATLPNASQTNDAAQNKALRWVALNRNDVAGIKQALDLGFPVVIAQDVLQSFYDMWSNGGVWSTNTGFNYGGHATCVVGYDDTRQMFKVQNQWGLGGDHGFYWVTYNLVQNNCLREVYIAYGVNPTVPPVINGDNSFCATSRPYTISSLVPGANVAWSLTPATGVATLNCTNCTQPTLTKVSNGFVTLNAAITDACGAALPVIRKSHILVGPVATIITGPYDPANNQTLLKININKPYYYVASETDHSTPTYKWTVFPPVGSDEFPTLYAGKKVTLTFHNVGTYIIQVQKTDPVCGNSVTQMNQVVSDGFAARINVSTSPNPTTGILTVTASNPSTETGIASLSAPSKTSTGLSVLIDKINVYDVAGVVRKTVTGLSARQIQLNISSLATGIYIVEVSSGKTTSRTTIFIQH